MVSYQHFESVVLKESIKEIYDSNFEIILNLKVLALMTLNCTTLPYEGKT